MTFELERAALIKFRTQGQDEFSSALSLVKDWKSQMLSNHQYRNQLLLFSFGAGDRSSAGDRLLFSTFFVSFLCIFFFFKSANQPEKNLGAKK